MQLCSDCQLHLIQQRQILILLENPLIYLNKHPVSNTFDGSKIKFLDVFRCIDQ